jgi:hypothetical protein
MNAGKFAKGIYYVPIPPNSGRRVATDRKGIVIKLLRE